MHLVLRFIVNAIALYLIAKYIPGFNHNATVGTALLAALIFGIVNALLGPILRFVTFPINVLTIGLFSFVVNYVLFAITVWLAPGLHTTGEINPWLANLYGTIVMTLVSTLMGAMSRPPERAGV
jgi:putative membrane protein